MSVTGNLVILEDIKKEHLDSMVKWRNDPEVSKYMFDQGVFTIEKQMLWYSSVIKDETRKQYTILEKKTGRPIGSINLMSIDFANSHADWGYYIGERIYRMGGYAVESEFLLLCYAFETLGLNKIYCRTLSNNMKVVSNHKNFGFSVDGILRRHHFDGKEYLDVYVMSILKEEFAAKKQELENLLSIFNR